MKLLNQCSLYSQHQHNQGHWKWENEWKVATEVHAIQQDTYSCGVFVMKVRSYYYFARYICDQLCENPDFTWLCKRNYKFLILALIFNCFTLNENLWC